MLAAEVAVALLAVEAAGLATEAAAGLAAVFVAGLAFAAAVAVADLPAVLAAGFAAAGFATLTLVAGLAFAAVVAGFVATLLAGVGFVSSIVVLRERVLEPSPFPFPGLGVFLGAGVFSVSCFTGLLVGAFLVLATGLAGVLFSVPVSVAVIFGLFSSAIVYSFSIVQ